MRDGGLAGDYLRRARVRLVALGVLFDAESWADVVRESQEIVELTLKGLLRSCEVDPPRTHDVSGVLLAEKDRLPEVLACEAEWLANVSRQMRRDRELAFYGAEDLLPGDFYSRGDAETARDQARRVVALVYPHVRGSGGGDASTPPVVPM